jgi:hypothetical protein
LRAIVVILAASIAAAAVTYLLFQGKITRLQNEHRALLTPRENAPTNQNASPAEVSDARTAPAHPDEELLRLRSEVAILSQQTNEMQQTLQSEALSFQAREISQQAKRSAGDLMLTIRTYTKDFDTDVVQANLEQLKILTREGSFTNLDLGQFEIVPNPAPWNSNSPNAIVVREQTARQTADGQWARVYGMVDGSVTEQISADGYFAPWEAEHLTVPRTNP